MKKLFVILSSLFVITAMSDVYADNQNPRVNIDDSCAARGVTVDKYEKSVEVSVPNNASTAVNVRMQNSDGTTYNYDTRSKNVSGNESTNHTSYKYEYQKNHVRETQEVDVKCYPNSK